MANNQVPASVRAQNFVLNTSKYLQKLSKKSFEENTTLSWDLPKVRFLSKISLICKGTFKATHASKTSYTKSTFDKYNLLRRVRMTLNNSFNPYNISGAMLAQYNKINKITHSTVDNFSLDVLGNVVSSGGTSNSLSFVIELPITLNERDPYGLLMLQNEQTLATLNLDTSTLASIMTDTDITLADMSIEITPVIESFSIPQRPDSVPDFSLIKLVNEQSEMIVGTDEMTVMVPIGNTYRKIWLYLASDANFTPISHAKIKEFHLILNQADYPIVIPADYVAYQNKKNYDGALGVGTYCFDFSEQGLANLGGSRDYLDTERLTRLELKIVFDGLTGSTNYVYLNSERIAKLV